MPISRRGLFRRGGQAAVAGAALAVPLPKPEVARKIEPAPAPPPALDYRPRVGPSGVYHYYPAFSASAYVPMMGGTGASLPPVIYPSVPPIPYPGDARD